MRNIFAAYFSPTGSTARIAGVVAEAMAECEAESGRADEDGAGRPDGEGRAEGGGAAGTASGGKTGLLTGVSLTGRDADGLSRAFGANDVLLAAVPVFGGRVPDVAVRRLEGLCGNGAPAAAVVVYGNRHYDDALLELVGLLEARGFRVAGAAAFVAEHSIVRSIAAGRPDGDDLAAARDFGLRVMEKILSGIADTHGPQVPGNEPYKRYAGLPFHPRAGRNCVRCGACARECPVGAVPESDPGRTDGGRCIACMRCVAVCPVGARGLSRAATFLARKAIEDKCRERRVPEVFL